MRGLHRLWIVVLLAVCIQPVRADDKQEAAKVARDTVEAVLGFLRDADASTQSKYERIMEVIDPVFDFSLMGKLALGRRFWPKLSDEQKQEYSQLFIEQLRKSYYDKIALFSNQKVEYEEPVQVKSKMHVATTIVSKAERHKILYKLYKAGKSWKVYDVEVQGVSIVSSYRAQYAQVLETGTVEELLEKMREKGTTGTDPN